MKRTLHIIIFVFFVFLILPGHKNAFAEVVVVHAGEAWLRTEVISKASYKLAWQIKEDDYWSFNTEMFPEGHNAEGIPVPALDSYALPGKNIGMLLGRIGDERIFTMGLSGSVLIKPGESGNFLYLTINDDLIGKYGNGFKDNTGEILVTITQTPIAMVEISILFIHGCPGYFPTKKHIEEIIAEQAIDAEVTLIRIDNDKDARQLHFIGSPTVRVGGMDIEEEFIGSKDYGVRSREYYIDGKPQDFPSKEMIMDAVRKELLLKEKEQWSK